MARSATKSTAADAGEREQMHALYRQGGLERQIAPHIVYPDAKCPHVGCGQPIQAIDFRLEDHGRAIHDPLVRAWWNDTGFAGRCPRCHGWIHFTLGGKRSVTEDEAARYPQLPDNWFDGATIL
jgi:hypothetical protein